MVDRLRCAIDVAPVGELADPAAMARLAVAAEAAGWDGLSTWDVLGTAMGTPAADPFLALAAVASRTERLRLIASVIVLPRRRPQLVAQAAATLDRWSGGRFVLGVGAGADPGDYTAFGEPFDTDRFARLDEDLALVDAFLRGETVDHEGPGRVMRNAVVGPRPVQVPRPPICLGGMKPGALRRAASWDGWIAVATSYDGTSMAMTPEAFEAKVERVRVELATAGRTAAPFDIAVFGVSGPQDREVVTRYADAGATWWLESLSPMRGSIDALLERIGAGPPG